MLEILAMICLLSLGAVAIFDIINNCECQRIEAEAKQIRANTQAILAAAHKLRESLASRQPDR